MDAYTKIKNKERELALNEAVDSGIPLNEAVHLMNDFYSNIGAEKNKKNKTNEYGINEHDYGGF